MNRINNFKNIKLKDLEQKLEIDGYAIIDDFLTQQQIEKLTEVYYSGIPKDLSNKPFMYTTASSNLAYKKKVALAIRDNCRNQINSLFPEYRLAYALFVNKKPQRKDSELKVHQDWSIVDESLFKAYYVWCPLTDVDENNGCLQVIKGSHRLRRFVEGGSTDIDSHYIRIMKNYLISLPMKAGQALIFNQRLLHGSFPNMSEKERIATNLAIISPNSTLIYLYPDNPVSPTQFEVFEVEDDFFENFVFASKEMGRELFRPENRESSTTIKYEHPLFTKREILETLSDNPSNTDSILIRNIKITVDIFVLNIEEQLFNLKGIIKQLLKYIGIK